MNQHYWNSDIKNLCFYPEAIKGFGELSSPKPVGGWVGGRADEAQLTLSCP